MLGSFRRKAFARASAVFGGDTDAWMDDRLLAVSGDVANIQPGVALAISSAHGRHCRSRLQSHLRRAPLSARAFRAKPT